MVKRPQGLNKSSKSKKKQRVGDEADKNGGEDVGAAEPMTIEVDQEIDPDDELGQLNALYDTFLTSPTDNNGLKSPKLLYGIIHECDRLLRNASSTLPSRFHNVYALSLLELSKFHESEGEKKTSKESSGEDGDTTEAFIEAAIERAEMGLSNEAKNSDLLFTRAKAEIALISVKINDMSLSPGERYVVASKLIYKVEKAVQDYEQAESLILDDPDTEKNKKGCLYTKDQLDTIESLLKVGESFGSLEYEREMAPFMNDSDPIFSKLEQETVLGAQQATLLAWSKNRWEQILDKMSEGKGKAKTPEEDGDHSYAVIRRANRGMGEYYLSISAPIISKLETSDDDDDDDDDVEEDDNEEEEEEEKEEDDDDEDDEDDDDDDEESKDIKMAKELLTKAIEHLLKAEHDSEQDVAVYPLIAEAQITLANLLNNDSDEQNVLYNEAVSRLKRAQRLGYGDYQEQIAELEC